MLRDDLRLDERHGRVTAAEAEQADLQKAPEQLQQDHPAFLLPSSVRAVPGRAHDGLDGFAAIEDCGHVQIHDLPEGFRRVVRQRFTRGDARVVDKDIHPAEPRPDGLHRRLHGRKVGQIRREADHIPAGPLGLECGDSPVGRLLPAAEERDARAVLQKDPDDSEPDPPRHARRDRCFSLQQFVLPETRIFMPLGYHILMKKHQSGYLNADIYEIRYIKNSIRQKAPLPGELSAAG